MKLPDREEILNMWLKYHNTNAREVIAKHSEEVLQSPKWFDLYKVTQEQHDQWEKDCKKMLRKKYKMPEFLIERGWWSIYLDCAPSVIIEE